MRSLCGIAWAMICAFGAIAAEEESVAIYAVNACGIRAGTVETVRSVRQVEGRRIESCRVHTKIDVDLLWISHHLDSTETILCDSNGLFQIAVDGVENGVTNIVRGHLRDGAFHYDIAKGGTNIARSIARTNYVCSTLDGIELQLQKDTARTIPVLASDRGFVIERTYTWTEDETLKAAGTNLACRIVAFKDANKQGRRWVCLDDFGLFIARQEGREKSGSYTLKLEKLFTRPLATASTDREGLPGS